MFSVRVMLLPLFFSCLFFHLETSYAVSLGDKAPDFSLPGSDGKTHNLRDHLGKNIVVIAPGFMVTVSDDFSGFSFGIAKYIITAGTI